MRRLAPLLVFLLGNPALADVKAGDDKLLHGDYQGAIGEFKAAKADVRLARALLLVGDYAGAEAAARAANGSDGKVALAEVQRATGRLKEARATLEDVVKKNPKHLHARAQLGLTLTDLGEKAAAAKLWNQFYDDFDAGRIDQNDAEQLLEVAIAARGLGDFHGASDQALEALAKNPNLHEANLFLGDVLLEKYNAAEADESYENVLKIDPNHPDAHGGLARARIEQNYDVKGAEEQVAKALAGNPTQPDALLVRAQLQIDNGEYPAAEKTLATLLAVNPNQLEAHAYLATMRWLKDDLAGYEAEKKKVFAQNPKWAPFYHIVGDFAVKEHRYKEAIALEEEALKVDPKYAVALAAIGTGYLRMGDEVNGVKRLEDAYDRDKFNVRTYNILNLFDERLKNDYVVFSPSKTFRFRVAKDERAALERYVPRTLDKAFKDMVKRYGFTPQLPVTIEMYNDPDEYSVRTVGLPNLGALGVCFGQVITALSPSNGNLNWGMILWHELGHVFAIQLSNSRVPRWFTEGLSEYETLIARPEWRRENDFDIWMAYAAGQLPSVVDLNARFLRAKDMNDMVVAYHMSSVTVEFLARKYGFPKIVEALKLYGKGKDTAEVIPAITGLAIKDFDAEFKKYLGERLKPYQGTFRVSLAEWGDVTALEKEAAAKPNDAEAQANVGLGWAAAGNADKATAAANAALKLDAKNKKALLLLADVAVAHKDGAVARQRLEGLLAAGGDGYDARIRLLRLAAEGADVKEVETQAAKAKLTDPERSEPYMLLAEYYFAHNREDDALKELEKYVYIEQMEYKPLKKLVDKYTLKKNWAKVRELGEMALFINPYDPDLHLAVADAYAAGNAVDDAVYEYQSALGAEPPLRRPAVAHIGLARVLLTKKDAAGARKELAEALKLEPQNAEALELSKKTGK